MRPSWCTAFAFAFALSLSTGSAHAALSGGVRVPAQFRSWTSEAKDGTSVTYSQFVVPFVSTVHLDEATRIVVSGKAANSGADLELGGMADARFDLFRSFADKRVLFVLGAGLPSGGDGLEEADRATSARMASPVLGFAVPEHGSGFDLSAAVAVQSALSRTWSLGASAGYNYRGEYNVFREDDSYDPSDEVRFSLGVKAKSPFGDGSVRHGLDATVSYRVLGDDEVGGEKVFREGNYVLADGGFWFSSSSVAGRADVYFGREDTHEIFINSVPTEIDAGNSLRARVGSEYRVGGPWWLGFSSEWSRFSGSEESTRDGSGFGVGPTLSTTIAGAHLRLEALRLWGQEDAELMKDRDLSGYAVSLSLRSRIGS